MTDIFHEIEEDLRRDRLRRVWDRFGIYFIILVVAIIAAAGAYSAYRYYSLQKAQAAGARFEAASTLAEDGKAAEAQAAFEALAKDGPSGYRTLARFRAAGEIGAKDKPAGVAAFMALANDGTLPPVLRDLASVRASLLQVDTAPLAEIKAQLQPLADGTGGLRHSARELLALAQFKAGNLADANKTAQQAIDDPEVPLGVRNRMELIRTLTAAAAQPAPASEAAAAAAEAKAAKEAPAAVPAPAAAPAASAPASAAPSAPVPAEPAPATPSAAAPGPAEGGGATK
ncbi:MAG TPA: tetratricopeptide repeat protein [Xanthobacteraceae bacterium]|nr:MAG: hypothetical protein B7Y61_18400 [Rhizobiales bacterium 35-66-30]OZB01207.1 MAG: hypothetical protein B7X67_20415 [Rhizobiales bacterium 39-66-18]HQS07960.1 tetratricopeptide repeat protein [Xanthobacteraceae bacterium]